MFRTPPKRTGAAVAAALTIVVAVAGCGGSSGSSSSSSTSKPSTAPTTQSGPTVAAGINLSSPVLAQGRPVPRRYTCDGLDEAPPLRWSGVPAGTAGLALLLEDLNSRGDSGAPFVHWSLFGIPASATRVPSNATEGTNDFHEVTYGGPCPPDNDPAHRYVFTLFALRAPLDVPPGSPPSDVRAALARNATAEGRLTVTYTRGGG